jgi:branched-chain amino acid transport system permease protein
VTRRTMILLGLLLLLAGAFPWLVPSPAITTIAVFTLLYAAAAVAWNLFSGYTGAISLGHGAFFGIGAYSMALVCQDWHLSGGWPPFLVLPLCALFACLWAAPAGWIALRVRGDAFVILTIALFFGAQLLAFNLRGLTNGSIGLNLPIPPWSGALFNLPFYSVALALLLLTCGVACWVRASRYGLLLLAIRDDEARAQSLGVRVGPCLLWAYVLSAAFVGMAGGIWAYFVGSIYPQFAFDPSFDVAIPLVCFLGGMGETFGPLVGTLLLVPLAQYLTLQFGAIDLDQLLYGALLLLILLGLPEGIVPTLVRLSKKRKTRPNAHVSALEVEPEEAALAVQAKKPHTSSGKHDLSGEERREEERKDA